MTANQRIVINFIATYGRSLLALVCGVFTGRWLLMTLGEVDYGLWGLVGGMAAFVTFFNDMFAGAVSRYYAVSVGKATETGDIEECRLWFNTALSIHATLPLFALAITYPIGAWAVRSFLTIPPERIDTCIVVWRFVCLSCFVNMVNVPFRAMYIAKQYIAELTVYSLFTTALNFSLVWYMVTHPGDWLARYAILVCLISSIPQLLICIRAVVVFPECRLRRDCLWRGEKIYELARYTGFRFVGAVSSMMQSQGLSIIVNKFMGPRFNTTMSVGTNLAGQTSSLSAALSGAMGPAIYNAYGAGDACRLLKLVSCSSRVGSLFYLAFAIPVALEIDELLLLWLKHPPVAASTICVSVMLAFLTEYLTDGQVCAIYATGRIAKFQVLLSLACLLGVILAFVLSSLGFGIAGIGASIVAFKSIIMIGRVLFAEKLASLSVSAWFKGTLCPIVSIAVSCLLVGYLPRFAMEQSFMRIIVTTFLTQVVLWGGAWHVILCAEERDLLMKRFLKFFQR